MFKAIIAMIISFIVALIVYDRNDSDLSAVLLSTPITIPCIFYAIKQINRQKD